MHKMLTVLSPRPAIATESDSGNARGVQSWRPYRENRATRPHTIIPLACFDTARQGSCVCNQGSKYGTSDAHEEADVHKTSSARCGLTAPVGLGLWGSSHWAGRSNDNVSGHPAGAHQLKTTRQPGRACRAPAPGLH